MHREPVMPKSKPSKRVVAMTEAIRRLIAEGDNLLPRYGEDPCGCGALAQDGRRCPWHVAVCIASALLDEGKGK